jgi:hypothetical protein
MVIELVSLRVRPTVSDADFVCAADSATTFLSSCPGFVRRRLAKDDVDAWVDYIEWRTREDAVAAAKRFNRAPETRAFSEAIEPGSVVTHHLSVHAAVN